MDITTKHSEAQRKVKPTLLAEYILLLQTPASSKTEAMKELVASPPWVKLNQVKKNQKEIERQRVSRTRAIQARLQRKVPKPNEE